MFSRHLILSSFLQHFKGDAINCIHRDQFCSHNICVFHLSVIRMAKGLDPKNNFPNMSLYKCTLSILYYLQLMDITRIKPVSRSYYQYDGNEGENAHRFGDIARGQRGVCYSGLGGKVTVSFANVEYICNFCSCRCICSCRINSLRLKWLIVVFGLFLLFVYISLDPIARFVHFFLHTLQTTIYT